MCAEWGKFGTEKKYSYFGGVHLLEVFTFGGFTVVHILYSKIIYFMSRCSYQIVLKNNFINPAKTFHGE